MTCKHHVHWTYVDGQGAWHPLRPKTTRAVALVCCLCRGCYNDYQPMDDVVMDLPDKACLDGLLGVNLPG